MQAQLQGSLFLEGLAGSGKTTAALSRLQHLLAERPGQPLLVLIPQRSLGKPYFDAIYHDPSFSGSPPAILTLGGLARRMISLFWPLAAQQAGFGDPLRPPQYLTLETAQYCMAQIVDPKMEQGFFHSITIDRNRIYSQIIDNMNKAAVVRFPLQEIAARLKADQNLEPSMALALEHAQACALDFRQYCLAHNALDFSLQIDMFLNHIWQLDICREYFYSNFRHLICDNLEEDVPATHDLIIEWLPRFDSALLIMDHNGGYRSFLGADPLNAEQLKSCCHQHILAQPVTPQSPTLQSFKQSLLACMLGEPALQTKADISKTLTSVDYRFYPQMISGVVEQIKSLLNEKDCRPADIVILAPYLSDVLKFSLSALLAENEIPSYSSRPSRSYIEEPAVTCLLTFAKLAHPAWNFAIPKEDLRHALMFALPGLDIIRADLIVQTLITKDQGSSFLRSFDAISSAEMQQRITFSYGEKIEAIRAWLAEYCSIDPQPLDVFLSRLFGELFSQNGFGFFNNFEAASRSDQLINAVRSFRQFLTNVFMRDEISVGIDFIKTIEAGLLPAVFLPDESSSADALLIAPAHSFLMENRSVKVQFWLDIGSLGWWERLNQPLTNPYLLRRSWNKSDLWTTALEYENNQRNMLRVVEGLLNRCLSQVVVCSVQVNERGSEQRGPLLRAFQTLRKRYFSAGEVQHV